MPTGQRSSSGRLLVRHPFQVAEHQRSAYSAREDDPAPRGAGCRHPGCRSRRANRSRSARTPGRTALRESARRMAILRACSRDPARDPVEPGTQRSPGPRASPPAAPARGRSPGTRPRSRADSRTIVLHNCAGPWARAVPPGLRMRASAASPPRAESVEELPIRLPRQRPDAEERPNARRTASSWPLITAIAPGSLILLPSDNVSGVPWQSRRLDFPEKTTFHFVGVAEGLSTGPLKTSRTRMLKWNGLP